MVEFSIYHGISLILWKTKENSVPILGAGASFINAMFCNSLATKAQRHPSTICRTYGVNKEGVEHSIIPCMRHKHQASKTPFNFSKL